jgi:anion-transporting  ArsA/GET3 family ATPase
VLTIDPARRLANALGLPEIGNRETRIADDAFRATGVEPTTAPMSAMMLDIKEAWDDVIQRYHPDPERGRRIAGNRMYQALSTALAGSQEYMAMEKLYQLARREEDPLDRIILDTPPAHHAVDFLDAPHRIIDALSNDATRWLIEPFRRGASGRSIGASFFVRTVSRLTGTELLQQLADMLEAFQAMFDGFQERAKAVRGLLESDETRFLVVSGPSDDGLDEARAFVERLRERSARVGAVILNRAHLPLELPSDGHSELRAAVHHAGGTDVLVEALVSQARTEARRAAEERERARDLGATLGLPVVVAPELPTDIRDLRGLDGLLAELLPSETSLESRVSSTGDGAGAASQSAEQ